MTDYEKALEIAESLIEDSEILDDEEAILRILKLAAILDNMKVLDANSIVKYMKELVILKMPEDKKEFIKKYL
jgi:hypothetical protein